MTQSRIVYLSLFLVLFAQKEISMSSGFNNSKYFESFQTPGMISEDYFVDYNSYLIRLEYLKTKPNGNKTGIMLEFINKKTFSSVSTLFTHTNGEFQIMDWNLSYINLYYTYDKQLLAFDKIRLSLPVRPYIGHCIWYCAKGEEYESLSAPIEIIDKCGFEPWVFSLGSTIGLKLEFQLNEKFLLLFQPDFEFDLFAPIKNADRTFTRSYILTAGISYHLSSI